MPHCFMRGVVAALLIGASKKVKLWFGSIYGGMIAIFLAGELYIKTKTGFFKDKGEWLSSGGSIELGDWVVPFYITLMITLVVLIDFRIFKKAYEVEGSTRWSLIVLGILFTLVYGVGVVASLFFVAFMFYPFAP
ncbi:hypothetical protein LC040_11020 [Bacillus tianshenii]|nr:hypothetical protein LC040_11020 [Bacillus tianshenii]